MIYVREDLPERRRCNIRSNGVKHGKKHRLSSAQQPRDETKEHHGNRKHIGESYNEKNPGKRQQRAESRPEHDRPLAEAVGQDAHGQGDDQLGAHLQRRRDASQRSKPSLDGCDFATELVVLCATRRPDAIKVLPADGILEQLGLRDRSEQGGESGAKDDEALDGVYRLRVSDLKPVGANYFCARLRCILLRLLRVASKQRRRFGIILLVTRHSYRSLL